MAFTGKDNNGSSQLQTVVGHLQNAISSIIPVASRGNAHTEGTEGDTEDGVSPALKCLSSRKAAGRADQAQGQRSSVCLPVCRRGI